MEETGTNQNGENGPKLSPWLEARLKERQRPLASFAALPGITMTVRKRLFPARARTSLLGRIMAGFPALTLFRNKQHVPGSVREGTYKLLDLSWLTPGEPHRPQTSVAADDYFAGYTEDVTASTGMSVIRQPESMPVNHTTLKAPTGSQRLERPVQIPLSRNRGIIPSGRQEVRSESISIIPLPAGPAPGTTKAAGQQLARRVTTRPVRESAGNAPEFAEHPSVTIAEGGRARPESTRPAVKAETQAVPVHSEALPHITLEAGSPGATTAAGEKLSPVPLVYTRQQSARDPSGPDAGAEKRPSIARRMIESLPFVGSLVREKAGANDTAVRSGPAQLPQVKDSHGPLKYPDVSPEVRPEPAAETRAPLPAATIIRPESGGYVPITMPVELVTRPDPAGSPDITSAIDVEKLPDDITGKKPLPLARRLLQNLVSPVRSERKEAPGRKAERRPEKGSDSYAPLEMKVVTPLETIAGQSVPAAKETVPGQVPPKTDRPSGHLADVPVHTARRKPAPGKPAGQVKAPHRMETASDEISMQLPIIKVAEEMSMTTPGHIPGSASEPVNMTLSRKPVPGPETDSIMGIQTAGTGLKYPETARAAGPGFPPFSPDTLQTNNPGSSLTNRMVSAPPDNGTRVAPEGPVTVPLDLTLAPAAPSATGETQRPTEHQQDTQQYLQPQPDHGTQQHPDGNTQQPPDREETQETVQRSDERRDGRGSAGAPDARTLAREIYPLIRNMIKIERERRTSH